MGDDVAVFPATIFGNAYLTGTDALDAGNPGHGILRRSQISDFFNEVHDDSSGGQSRPAALPLVRGGKKAGILLTLRRCPRRRLRPHPRLRRPSLAPKC